MRELVKVLGQCLDVLMLFEVIFKWVKVRYHTSLASVWTRVLIAVSAQLNFLIRFILPFGVTVKEDYYNCQIGRAHV